MFYNVLDQSIYSVVIVTSALARARARKIKLHYNNNEFKKIKFFKLIDIVPLTSV